MMTLASVKLQTLVSEPDALTTRPGIFQANTCNSNYSFTSIYGSQSVKFKLNKRFSSELTQGGTIVEWLIGLCLEMATSSRPDTPRLFRFSFDNLRMNMIMIIIVIINHKLA